MNTFSKRLDELVRDREIEDLERRMEKFNIFTALRVERLEVQHSNFLAYLLNPRQKHGLEDRFLKKFLQAALRDCVATDVHITPIDVDTWELRNVEVSRERKNTDIFITDDRHFAMVIENKVDSGEHDDQLGRYRRELAQEFPTHERLLFYLTPAGTAPEDGEERDHWIPVDYASVERVLKEEILGLSADLHLTKDIEFTLQHYLEVLRRYIVADSEEAKRCRAFYRKHKPALDFIRDRVNEQRFRLVKEARTLLEEAIANDEDFELDECTNTDIKFALRKIDEELPRGGTATKSGRILFLALWFEQTGISFGVTVGPAPPTDARKSLFRLGAIPPLRRLGATSLESFLKTQWNTIYQRTLIESDDYSSEREEFIEKLKSGWDGLKKDELPKVADAIQKGLRSPGSESAS